MNGRGRLINSAVRTILRSPLHRLLSGRLAIVTYIGRRSLQTHTLPVMYARHADTYCVLVGNAANKKWWRNFHTRQPARLLVGGKTHHLLGEVLSVDHPGHAPALRAYQTQFPRARLDTTDPVLVAFDNASAQSPKPPDDRSPQGRLP